MTQPTPTLAEILARSEKYRQALEAIKATPANPGLVYRLATKALQS